MQKKTRKQPQDVDELVDEACDDRLLYLTNENARLRQKLRKRQRKKHHAAPDSEEGGNQAGYVQSLQEHVQRLTIGLSREAQEKLKAQDVARKLEKKLMIEKEKVKLMKEKHSTMKQTIRHMKAEIDMLHGQMYLADDRYSRVKSRLDMQVRSKNEESEIWKRVCYKAIKSIP